MRRRGDSETGHFCPAIPPPSSCSPRASDLQGLSLMPTERHDVGGFHSRKVCQPLAAGARWGPPSYSAKMVNGCLSPHARDPGGWAEQGKGSTGPGTARQGETPSQVHSLPAELHGDRSKCFLATIEKSTRNGKSGELMLLWSWPKEHLTCRKVRNYLGKPRYGLGGQGS